MLSCMSWINCIYIWDINHLQIIPFDKYFCCSIGCLFIGSVVSFPVQRSKVLLGPICLFLIPLLIIPLL